jgi:hypothetical protein
LFILAGDFLRAIKLYDMGPPALLLLRMKACYEFYHPQKPIASAGFEPENLESDGNHANHYTTEATLPEVTF